jgi:hypothetical protein
MSPKSEGRGPGRQATKSGRPALRSPCVLCQLILDLYPTLECLVEGDRAVFLAHLKEAHGLIFEIPA